MSDLIGKTIDHYQILEQIGMGGMATVYKAYQLSMDRYVAIKVLPSHFAQDPNFVKRFAHEAKAIAALEHPHILPVHDFGTEGDVNYMVMRYVEGGTLGNLMGKPMPYDQIVRIISNVARALNYAHQKGVVHRDIKPSNILLDKQGEVLLTDFGIAKIVEGAKSTQLTADGSILGTPAYMAPEQAQGGKLDGRTDIYSLGVVLYELLTGRPPYHAETPFAVALKHITEPLPPPRSVKPDIPEAFERVVLKAMAKNPEQRYETASQMAQALEGALREAEGTLIAIPSPTPKPQPEPRTVLDAQSAAAPAKRSSMNPLLIGGAIVLVLLCLMGLGGFLILAVIGSTVDERDVTSTPIAGRLETEPEATPTQASRIETEATPTPSPELDNTPTEEPEETDEPQPDTTPVVPTEEPTEEATAVPSGGILFEDDFSADEGIWYIGAEKDEYSDYKAEIVDGIYRTQTTAIPEEGASVWFELVDSSFEDFIFSVEAVSVDRVSDSFSYGLIFRSDLEGNFYSFEIDDDGFSIWQARADSDWEVLMDYTETEAIEPGGPNQLVVKGVGSSLTFYINDEEVATLVNDEYGEGSVGLIVSTYDKGKKLSVDFDNVEVTAP